jgi:hypothetical protein
LRFTELDVRNKVLQISNRSIKGMMNIPMNTNPKNNIVTIQGKNGELLAAAVMLSKHGIEVSVPKALMKPIADQAFINPDFNK